MTAFENHKKKKEKEQIKQTLLSDNANIIKLLKDLNSKEWKPEVNVETPKAEVDVKVPEIKVPKAEVDVNIPEIPTPEVTVINDNKNIIDVFKKLPLSDIQKILKDIKTESKKGDVALVKSIRELEKAIKKISISFSAGGGGGTDNKILQQIADNTDTLELKADQINLNTDEIESKLDTLENDKALASKQLPNDHDVTVSNQITGFSTSSKQDEQTTVLNTIATNTAKDIEWTFRGTDKTSDMDYKYLGFKEKGGNHWYIMRFTLANKKEVLYSYGDDNFDTAWDDPTLLTYN